MTICSSEAQQLSTLNTCAGSSSGDQSDVLASLALPVGVSVTPADPFESTNVQAASNSSTISGTSLTALSSATVNPSPTLITADETLWKSSAFDGCLGTYLASVANDTGSPSQSTQTSGTATGGPANTTAIVYPRTVTQFPGVTSVGFAVLTSGGGVATTASELVLSADGKIEVATRFGSGVSPATVTSVLASIDRSLAQAAGK
jgi:hypothetical protein